MAHSQDSTLVDEEAFPGDWLDEEDRESVRRRHAESVERWLDAASFANELFKLHAKYGIEQGDEGYKAYRLYLQQQYEKMLLTNGPMVDPLGEGCDCLFCRFDHDEISFRPAKSASADEATSPQPVTPTTVPRADPQSARSQITAKLIEPAGQPVAKRKCEPRLDRFRRVVNSVVTRTNGSAKISPRYQTQRPNNRLPAIATEKKHPAGVLPAAGERVTVASRGPPRSTRPTNSKGRCTESLHQR